MLHDAPHVISSLCEVVQLISPQLPWAARVGKLVAADHNTGNYAPPPLSTCLNNNTVTSVLKNLVVRRQSDFLAFQHYFLLRELGKQT